MLQADLNSQQKLIQKIKQWKEGLADLSLRNPLLNFKPNNNRALEIIAPQSFILFKDLVNDKKILRFQREGKYKIDESEKLVELRTRETQDEALKKLKKLRSEALLSLEEKGVNTLFLAFGTLTWYDIDRTNEALLSPLILVPVELKKESKKDVYEIIILEEEIAFNPALLLSLKQKFGIDFPEKETIQDKNYNELIAQARQLVETQATWSIEDNVFLSLFSYAKAAMVRDITENEDLILNHPILQAISGDLQAYQANFKEPLEASKLDSIKPELMFQVLDADSSQQVVIEAAKKGSSFVVQGPPGTGKSQTIVNMITELIGEGKSVLLVAEKETALQVVYDRISECGLGYLCLSINHRSTAEKRKFIANLTTSINSIEQINLVNNEEKHDNFFSELKSNRESINSYITALHTKVEPLNMSPFELYGELLKMQSEKVPNVDVILPNFNQWTQKYLNQAKELLNQVTGFLPFFYGEKELVWAKSSLNSYSFELQLELKQKIREFQESIDESQTISQYLQLNFEFLPLSTLRSLQKCYEASSHVLKAPTELPENWVKTDIKNAEAVFAQLKADVQIIESFKSHLSEKYSSELFSLDLLSLAERYQKYSRFWFIRIFNLNYWRDYRRLQKLLISPHKIFHHELKRDLVQAAQVQFIRNQFNQSSYPPCQVFGKLFNPQISQELELKPLEQALSWLIGLQRYSFPNKIVNQIINSSTNRQSLEKVIHKLSSNTINITKGLDFLLLYFKTNDIIGRDLPSNKIDLPTLKIFLERANSDLSDFQGWLLYRENRTKLSNMGTEKFLSILRREKIDTRYWFPVLKKSIYQTCLDAVLAQKTELKFFDAEKHKETLNEFASLDQKQLEVSRERLKQIHITRWRDWKKIPTSLSELQNLKRESMMIRNHLPIRKLLNDREKGIPNLVKTLKPCWMMSPLAVSQYIDPDVIHFDVLIFDEASQLRTEDVVSSIIRADQIIIIGDNKQLPPTSFFAPIGDGGGGGLESVLDECSTFMFRHILKWHYRSQDERLIAFSNRHFYDSQLVTFPNPIQNPDLGVYFKHVPDGVFDAGAGGKKDNRREAAVVAQLTLEHFQQHSEQSLGIIAFSQSQADSIQEQIEILGKDHPELETFCRDSSPKFFLKALENVQGDERDVILLSVGYGHNAEGQFHLNLGPITNIGGERRLNVAITRAKSKIILISSIRAGHIDLGKVKHEGVKALRDYLGYAESGGNQLQGPIFAAALEFDSPFEADVYYSLKEHPLINDYIIRTQVGCSGYRIDLAIAHESEPGKFLLGIECDGASYHNAPNARDRDRLRQQILERLGWKFIVFGQQNGFGINLNSLTY